MPHSLVYHWQQLGTQKRFTEEIPNQADTNTFTVAAVRHTRGSSLKRFRVWQAQFYVHRGSTETISKQNLSACSHNTAYKTVGTPPLNCLLQLAALVYVHLCVCVCVFVCVCVCVCVCVKKIAQPTNLDGHMLITWLTIRVYKVWYDWCKWHIFMSKITTVEPL